VLWKFDLLWINAVSLDALWRAHSPRILAALTARLRDLSAAEDAVSAAFEQALRWNENWPSDPPAWLFKVAWNAALDAKRRRRFDGESVELSSSKQIDWPAPGTDGIAAQASTDERLAMFFLCAHPSLSADSQAMLILRFCAGIAIPDIARWFQMESDAVRRRLHRAQEKIQQAGVRYELPEVALWPQRLPSVLSAIEIIYDQSFSDVAGGVERDGFARDGEQLALQLVEYLPRLPEVLGLAALIVLAESRRPARVFLSPEMQPQMIALDQQDVHRWDATRIHVAAALLARASKLASPGPYQIRASIFAQHARRAQLGLTPWPEILALYDGLIALEPSPQAHINRTLALSKVHGAQVGLAQLLELNVGCQTVSFHLAHASLRSELGQSDHAAAAFDAALKMPLGAAERAFVQAQRHAIVTLP
jgi:RNA polymerase sigma-70 factor, ECF subfamily